MASFFIYFLNMVFLHGSRCLRNSYRSFCLVFYFSLFFNVMPQVAAIYGDIRYFSILSLCYETFYTEFSHINCTLYINIIDQCLLIYNFKLLFNFNLLIFLSITFNEVESMNV